jgi:hypothetical protein
MRTALRTTCLACLAVLLSCICLASDASASAPVPLTLSQSAAFSILGRSCGGIQEQVYATGFGLDGYPTADVYMQTKCGGSGRGGGYKTTTYSAWATVTWDWFGDTRAFARLEGAGEGSTTFSAQDAYGDRIYNTGTSALLETGNPPLVAPAAPTQVAATVSAIEGAEEQEPTLWFDVSSSPAPETAGLISSSTVTATPVGSSAPVLTATTSGSATTAVVGPLARHTTYAITVTDSDAEGTSQPSSPIEASSASSEPPPPTGELCAANSGTIKLTPGLTATPHVQSVTVNGRLTGCEGVSDATEGAYVAHLSTSEEASCATLTSPLGQSTTPGPLVVKWLPLESGKSTGTLSVALGESSGAALEGVMQGGPFAAPVSVLSGSIYETFKKAATCGMTLPGKTAPVVVKSATFVGSSVELG